MPCWVATAGAVDGCGGASWNVEVMDGAAVRAGALVVMCELARDVRRAACALGSPPCGQPPAVLCVGAARTGRDVVLDVRRAAGKHVAGDPSST